MREWAGKRYWIVGASEGLGRALAMAMSKVGTRLVLSARDEERLKALAAELPGLSQVVPCDIGDIDSVRAAAAEIGEIDGVVILAGVYWPQGAKDWNADEVITMCDVNFTGTARVLGEVVPAMVARDSGHIVITGSLSGFRGLPNAIGYGASKAAVMSLAESMQADLRHTGIEVQMVNPGFIRTRLTDKNDFKMPGLMEPEQAAREMLDHLSTDRFKQNFPWTLATVLRLSQFLPDWLYFPLFGARR